MSTGVTKAVILVGGKATRLLPLTCNTPKAMVPVLNTPFLEHVIHYLKRYGVIEITLAQSHLPEPITHYFGDGSRFGVRLNYAIEASPLGTAGAVKNAEPYLSGTFLVLNGDIFSDLDIAAMVDSHFKRRAMVTIALTPVENPAAYGLVETEQTGRITRFLEKPAPDQITTNMINAGTYVMDAGVLSRIPPVTSFMFERDVFPALLAANERAYAFPSDAYWIDIGTPEKYLSLQRAIIGRNNPSRPATPVIETPSRIAPSARIEGTVLIAGSCTIGPGARLVGPLTIGPGCTIMDKATVEDSILWQSTIVEAHATIRKSIIADHSVIETGSIVEGCILGDHVTLTAGRRLEPGTRTSCGQTIS